jgi:hypothetical protein
MILDAAPPEGELGGVAVGDVDGNGRLEIVIGPGIYYKPQTRERHVISNISGHAIDPEARRCLVARSLGCHAREFRLKEPDTREGSRSKE